MFGRYSLPNDDLAQTAVAVTASAEDAEYPAENIIANPPSRPAKLTTETGWWKFDFGTAISPIAAAVIYHNLDAGLPLILQANSIDDFTAPPFQQQFDIPAHHEDGWPVSPWMALQGNPSYRWWLLVLDAGSPANSLDLQVGRLLLVDQLRDLGTDVRWGVEEGEEHTIIEQATELGVETIYPLGGKRRRFSGEFGLYDSESSDLLALHRSAQGRNYPWLLIPDVAVNDAWFVRFEGGSSRIRQAPNHNVFPFRVQELSRGLPWP